MEALCRQEIVELHQFFQGWYRGDLADTEEQFNRFVRVLANDFTIITPTGSLNHREATLAMVRQGYGSWRERNGRIWIENIVLRWQDEGQRLLTYEEWQEIDDRLTARLSTVLFRSYYDAAHDVQGVQWVHLHETWLPTREA
jgi:hypothetical protein